MINETAVAAIAFGLSEKSDKEKQVLILEIYLIFHFLKLIKKSLKLKQ
jgi:hypothetical protein